MGSSSPPLASTTVLSPPPSAPNPPRRRSSATTRIDEILETARQRSIVFQAGEHPMSIPRQPSLQQLPEHDGPAGEGHESSADEQTAIMRRDNTRKFDYQGTSTSLRARNSLPSVKRTGECRSEHATGDDNESWWRRQVEKYGSIELENKGSVARDHLALERTFLAWLRTSLAFASIGIAITQLFRLSTSLANGSDPTAIDPFLRLRQLGKPLGATFLGVSMLVLWIGFQRYFEGQHWIIRGKFPASRGSVAIVSVVAFALMITSLVVVLVVEPSSFEKRSM